MLAATIKDVSAVNFPVLASPKLDGVRVLNNRGTLFTRALKPVPNPHVNVLFGSPRFHGADGELIVDRPTAPDCYRQTVAGVMREHGEPLVRLFVFDNWDSDLGFEDRIKTLNPYRGVSVVVLEQRRIKTEKQLLDYESECLDAGYEGLILRSPQGVYKFGRSTMKEQGMMKLKRFEDSEARILEVIEEMENTNAATKNELGRTSRSSAKKGLVPKGRAGGLAVRDCYTGVEFTVGTGLDDNDKEVFWKQRKTMIGQVVKYKFFPVGVKDKPRHPVYLGLRPAGA
jgi:DNA ligase-1